MNKKNKIILGVGLSVLALGSVILVKKQIDKNEFLNNNDIDEKKVSNFIAKNPDFLNNGIVSIGGKKNNLSVKFYDYKISIDSNGNLRISSKGKSDIVYKVTSEFGGSDSNNLQNDTKINLQGIWINKKGDVKLVGNKDYLFNKKDIKLLTKGIDGISLDIKNKSFADIIFGSNPYLNFKF